MNLRKIGAWACTVAALATTAGCATSPSNEAIRTVASGTVDPLTDVGGSLVVTVGDIACAPGGTVTTTTCRDAATASLAKGYRPRYALILGDEQYQAGTAAQFRDGYDKTWGALRSISKPIPGNHEYSTAGASGYYSYFAGQTRSPGYYAFNINNWRVYALNSNCSKIDCATEASWLDHDLTQNPHKCSLLMMHHPLYSSGLEHGDSPEGRPFWQIGLRHGVDLVLAGHDHDYERFQRMNADGGADARGIASFVVGTGGKSLYHSRGIRAGSQVYDAHRAGVMALKLGAVRYGWQYKTIDGKVMDSGLRYCI
jgi:acid phosphatase type 7